MGHATIWAFAELPCKFHLWKLSFWAALSVDFFWGSSQALSSTDPAHHLTRMGAIPSVTRHDGTRDGSGETTGGSAHCAPGRLSRVRAILSRREETRLVAHSRQGPHMSQGCARSRRRCSLAARRREPIKTTLPRSCPMGASLGTPHDDLTRFGVSRQANGNPPRRFRETQLCDRAQDIAAPRSYQVCL